MNEDQLEEIKKISEEKYRLRMIADSLYTEARKTHSRKEIHNRPRSLFIDLDQYSETDANLIRRYIKCLCISEYEPSDTSEYHPSKFYEYSFKNLYDPTFMDKFTYLTYLHWRLDLTEELFGDENRAALEKRKE